MTSQFRCLDTGHPMTVSRQNFERITVVDEFPDLSWLDDVADRQRLDAYDHGFWNMIGVRAKATFLIPLNGHYVIQTITTPGLWGIESDSDDAYLDDVFSEECMNLAAMLATLGVRVTA